MAIRKGAKGKHHKKGRKADKIGGPKGLKHRAKCARYRNEGRRERNKERRAKRIAKRFRSARLPKQAA